MVHSGHYEQGILTLLSSRQFAAVRGSCNDDIEVDALCAVLR